MSQGLVSLLRRTFTSGATTVFQEKILMLGSRLFVYGWTCLLLLVSLEGSSEGQLKPSLAQVESKASGVSGLSGMSGESGAAQASEYPLQFHSRIYPSKLSESFLSTEDLEADTNPELQITLHLQDHYKAYSEQLKIEVIEPVGIELKLASAQLSPEIEFLDPVTKKIKKGVEGHANWTIPLRVSEQIGTGNRSLKVQITSQVCTAKFCLLPKKTELDIPFQIELQEKPQAGLGPSGFWHKITHFEFRTVFKMGLLWTFVFVFFAGVLASFTPCIFPMIPITLAVLGRDAHLRSKRQQWLVSHLYVLGIAAVYSGLGLVAASTGALFGSFMSHPLVLGAACLVFLLMSLSMFGVFEISPPQGVSNKLGHLQLKGPLGIFLQGCIAGILASPCVGPVLVGILTYVAQTQKLWLGFWLLFVFALGMGQLFLLFGISSQFGKWLPRSGAWMVKVKYFFGTLILIPFFYYLHLLVPAPYNPLKKQNFTGEAIQSVQKEGGTSASAESRDSQDKPRSPFIPYSEQLYKEALETKKPIIIDFWAEWCVACLQLEEQSFASPEFVDKSKDVLKMKFDATKESPELEVFKKRFGIVGLPTIVFIDATGRWRKELTIHELIPKEDVLNRVEKLLGSKAPKDPQ